MEPDQKGMTEDELREFTRRFLETDRPASKKDLHQIEDLVRAVRHDIAKAHDQVIRATAAGEEAARTAHKAMWWAFWAAALGGAAILAKAMF